MAAAVSKQTAAIIRRNSADSRITGLAIVSAITAGKAVAGRPLTITAMAAIRRSANGMAQGPYYL